MVRDGLLPLGRVATPAGRLLCFPNSHIHKDSKLTNTGTIEIDRDAANLKITNSTKRATKNLKEASGPAVQSNKLTNATGTNTNTVTSNTTTSTGNNTRKTTETSKAKRTIVVFFVVDPSRRIVSTREVPPQQRDALAETDHEAGRTGVGAGGGMSRADALAHRLKLMEERKYYKQDWNVREIELC